MLYTLNKDVIEKQRKQTKELDAFADSLVARNNVLNHQLEEIISQLNQADWYYSFAPSLDFLLPKHFRLGMNGGLYKNARAPWTENKPIYMYSFYANKSFLKGRLNVSITANSPFNL